jgi:5-methyltetrahydrofolate--homocysteine methyltransferase
VIERAWRFYYRRIHDSFMECNGGCCSAWIPLLSRESFYPSQCDFSALISPAMFADLVVPSLRREGEFVGTIVYHLDGQEEIAHLDHLFGIDSVRAVQWVPAAGTPEKDDECYDELYRRILDAGRRIVLVGFPPRTASLKRLFGRFPKNEFFIVLNAPDARTADELAALA